MAQINDWASFLSATAGADLLILLRGSPEQSTFLHRTDWKDIEEMRIRDATCAMHHQRAVGTVILTSRASGVDASASLDAYFSRGLQYEIAELSLLRNRFNEINYQQLPWLISPN